VREVISLFFFNRWLEAEMMWSRRAFLGAVGTTAGAAAVGSCNLSRQGVGGGTKLDRMAVLKRHSPRVKSADQGAVMSVGNGSFAFNVDCTGLQTLHGEYKTIPLCTLSHWGWHSVPAAEGMDWAHFKYHEVPFYGRRVPYATDQTGQAALFNYLRANPHMLHLGRVALVLDGKPIAMAQVSDIDQRLDLASGIVTSRFTLAGAPVEVTTCCHGEEDGIGVRVVSGLLARPAGQGKLAVEIAFPYGSTVSNGDGADWTKPAAHRTVLRSGAGAGGGKTGTFERTLDATHYQVRGGWNAGAIREVAAHQYLVEGEGPALELSLAFDRTPSQGGVYSFGQARESSAGRWERFWNGGAALDLGNCTDARAPELERRIVLSQYLTAIHCAGEYPSQETGLLCNSWYGKFHLEMHWWHSVHFTVWNRFAQFERSLGLYARILESSKKRAQQQGFAGARWPKMIGPDGEDSPSPVGPMLIWQQPHPIYYAELCYRQSPTRATLARWREIVLQTAEFMASFAQYVAERNQYVLGPMIKTVSENNPTSSTLNPTWEVTSWRLGLRTAQAWLERMGERRNAGWDKVLRLLAPAPMADGVYQMQEGMATFTKEWAWEHPALLGALGVLPGDQGCGIDKDVMARTAQKVRSTWDFARVWGWDFPTAAMCAARSGLPELAVDYLTMDAPMNSYLPNGCNFQRANVPAYFPGNGGILAAVGMMSGGWGGGPGKLAGWPKNGKWEVRAERFGVWI
jgi:hypothetical protein